MSMQAEPETLLKEEPVRRQRGVAPVLDPSRNPLPERLLVADSPQGAEADGRERDLKSELGGDASPEGRKGDVLRHAQRPDVVRRREPYLDDNLPVLRGPFGGS